MADVYELVADAQAVARTLRLSAADTSRPIVRVIVLSLDEIATTLLSPHRARHGNERAIASLTRVRSDLLGLLEHGGNPPRKQLLKVQRALADLLVEIEGFYAGSDNDGDSATRDPAAGGSPNRPDEDHNDSGALVDRTPELTRNEEGLRVIATAYRREARRKAPLMIVLLTVAFIAVAVATAMGWYLLVQHQREPASKASIFLVEWTPAAGLLAVTLFLVQHAARVGRQADELRRLARQLESLTTYLRPLPMDTRSLILSAMTQRLFPRLLDDDPLREEDWFPADDTLLASINPDLARLALAQEDDDEDHDDDDATEPDSTKPPERQS